MDFRQKLFPKKIRLVSGLILIFLFYPGCGLHIRENPETQASSTEALKCMDDLNQQFRDYLDQNLHPFQINSMFDCLKSSLIVFKYHVWGEDKQTYTPEELRKFIHEFILEEKKISDSLMKEFMTLKVSLAGGGSDRLLPEEIDQLISVLENLKEPATKIYPYNQAFLKNREDLPPAYIDKAFEMLIQVVTQLSSDLFKESYSLKSFERLIHEGGLLFDDSFDIQQVEMISTLKSFIFSHSYENDQMMPDEWDLFLKSLIHIVAVSIYSHKTFLVENKIQDKMMYFDGSFRHALDLLKTKIHHHPDRLITQKDMMDLIDRLYQKEWIPERIQRASIQSLLKAVFGKIVAQNRNPSDFRIGNNEYLWLKSQYEKWKKTQEAIRLGHHFLQENPKETFETILDDTSLAQNLFGSALDEVKFLYKFRPLYLEKDPLDLNIYFKNLKNIPFRQFGYKNLSLNSFYWLVIRMVMRGYAHVDPQQGITEKELTVFLKDIYGFVGDLGVNLSSLPPDSKNFGKTEFLVANLLTYETKGYYTNNFIVNAQGRKLELINEREGVEYLSLLQFIFRTQKILQDELEFLCQGLISPSCFSDHILKLLEQKAHNMPHLQKFLPQMNLEEKMKYIETLMDFTTLGLQEATSSDVLSRAQLRNVVLALLYQEMTMARFDYNSDDVLQENEIEEALHLYKGMIQYVARDFLCLDVDEIVDKQLDEFLYHYSVHHRGPPNFREIQNQILGQERLYIQMWLNENLGLWNLTMDRPSLLKMAFNLSASFIRNIRKNKCQNQDLRDFSFETE